MKHEYIAPEYKLRAFHCPLCNVYADQIWTELHQFHSGSFYFNDTDAATCGHCKQYSVWHDGVMVYPDFQGVQSPNSDLSDDIKADYEEAASILQKSPRGAAALLRLAVQKLCRELGEEGRDINNDIKELVSKGLPSAVQKSLDAVRVIGNEAVHPGQIDLRDDVESAQVLFKLVNLIAEKMITEPKEVESIYASLPESKRKQIEKRDEK
jgi:predicted heme/steroid binding protein